MLAPIEPADAALLQCCGGPSARRTPAGSPAARRDECADGERRPSNRVDKPCDAARDQRLEAW